MAIYSCNRYRLIVLALLILIMWQVFRLLPTKSIEEPQHDVVELDDKYNKHKEDKIKIRVYYEALCPDSKHFFVKHLLPVTEKLSDFLDIYLVPYGKATTKEQNGQYFFSCQHGEEECFANKIHACSIDVLSNMTSSVQFTECMIIDNMNAVDALKRCGKQMNVDTGLIAECAGSEHGSQLLKKYGDETLIVKPTFIPTVLLNGSRGNQAGLLKNFLLEVCKEINMPLPPACL